MHQMKVIKQTQPRTLTQNIKEKLYDKSVQKQEKI